jgi:multimeric flavodoxin WrbA
MNNNISRTVSILKKKRKVLFITTSNRWSGEKEDAKSTLLAKHIAGLVGEKRVTIIDATRLNIYPCEGNVSARKGNYCGEQKAALKDASKNPSGNHRCWASINNKDDELWVVSKALLESDAVVFFGSVRWGQMNSVYQKLIERLTWLENRHATLGEGNLLEGIDAGLICTGHNWNGANVVKLQKQVLSFFGFRVQDALSWSWQFTKDSGDESQESYRAAFPKFAKEFGIGA